MCVPLVDGSETEGRDLFSDGEKFVVSSLEQFKFESSGKSWEKLGSIGKQYLQNVRWIGQNIC